MSDIAVIIHTENDRLHIKRCLERLAPLAPRQIFIVDCFSTDGTREAVTQYSAEISSCGAEEFRKRAVAKVEEWLEGISEEVFVAALDKLLDEKILSGEYRFKGGGGKVAMREGAIRFFREFSRRIVQLSDGRCVYFTPDERARKRNQNNAVSWAEYAVHAVTSSGKMLEGKEYRERLYNPRKASVLQVLESVISAEHCMYRLIDSHPENDAVLFIGHDAEGARLEVVTRLDLFGNVDANLAEVTVVATHKKKREKEISPPPKHYRPLTEVVETVAKHQAAGFSPSTTVQSITYLAGERKGACPIISLVEHEWPGNQAAQFQWALDNLPIEAKWILRLDADEYLTDELIAEIKEKLPQMEDGVDGVVLKRRHVVGWLGNRWIKRGMYPARILRLFRRGHGRSDMKIMDEHIVVDGKVIEFDNDFVDHSLISFEDWKAKHRGYAKREAQSYLSGERSTGEKAAKKEAYYKLPRYFRAFAYFFLRYVVKRGFLDGLPGFRWHFYQGLWYRCLVDREIGKLKSHK